MSRGTDETLTQALRRTFEQVNDNQTTMLDFSIMQDFDIAMRNAVEASAIEAMGKRFWQIDGGNGLRGTPTECQRDHIKIAYQCQLAYSPLFLDFGDPYAYHGGRDEYHTMINAFRDGLRKRLGDFYGVVIHTATGYGSSSRYKKPGRYFQFYITVTFWPGLAGAKLAA